MVKQSAVAPEMLRHKGPARVFNSEEEAIAVIYAGGIRPGDVVVIRYEGPKGGPGMREMLNPTSAIDRYGLDKGRGPHHRRPVLRRDPGEPPSATSARRLASGGVIGSGDGRGISLRSTFPAGPIHLCVEDAELAERRKTWVCPEPKIKSRLSDPLRQAGVLCRQGRYSAMRAELMHTVEALDSLILFRQKPDSLLRRLMATEEAVRVAAQGELVALAVENGWQGDLWRCCIARELVSSEKPFLPRVGAAFRRTGHTGSIGTGRYEALF